MRENELQGNISIDKYNEVMEGYSVFDSTKDFLAQWAKDNAQENAEIQGQTEKRLAKVCKVKVCKNGNLFVGCYDEQATKYVNFFLAPAIVLELAPTGVQLVQAEYQTTPKGHTVQTGWNWVDDNTLSDRFKDLRVVYSGNTILEVF